MFRVMNETETQIRLRRAKEALENSRAAETAARKALAEAVESTKRAKEKYEALFLANEAEECDRRKKDWRSSK